MNRALQRLTQRFHFQRCAEQPFAAHHCAVQLHQRRVLRPLCVAGRAGGRELLAQSGVQQFERAMTVLALPIQHRTITEGVR